MKLRLKLLCMRLWARWLRFCIFLMLQGILPLESKRITDAALFEIRTDKYSEKLKGNHERDQV